MTTATKRKHVTAARIESVSSRAQRMLDDNRGDKAKTIRQLINLSESQPTLRAHLIKLGATACVGGLICRERAALVRGVSAEEVKFTTHGTVVTPIMSFKQAEMRRRAARNNVVRAWLNFRLPTEGNKQLGKANSKEVGEAAEQYRRQSGDMQHKAAWMDAIKARLPKGKTVADVLDDHALDALYEKVSA